MTVVKTNIYTNSSGLKHDTGPGHPEQIARLQSVLSVLEEEPFSLLPRIEAKAAEEEWIAYAHKSSYIDSVLDAVPDQGHWNLDGDTVICPHSWDAALTAAGAVCQAVDDVQSGNCTRAFCAVRPPGHHAVPDKAMGFCIFNNIFIGARYAQEKYGIRKIVIIDPDVHHGNGTDFMARQAENIFYISSHQFPHYPGTGDPQYDEHEIALNIPFEAGAGSKEFRESYEKIVFPAIDKFAPDLIMISAGFDAHELDPLADMNLTDDDYAWMTEKLCALADKHCGGKVIAALEGGYNLEALKTAVRAHLGALAEI